MEMGRPSLYSEQVVEAICSRLATGEPLAVICRDEGLPAYRTVKNWADEKGEDGQPTDRAARVSAAIACARDEGEESILADCLTIADTPVEAEIVKVERRAVERTQEEIDAGAPVEYVETVVERRREDAIQHRKLQIDTRLKLLAKWNPKKWGDRTTLAGDPTAPLQVFSRIEVVGVTAKAPKE